MNSRIRDYLNRQGQGQTLCGLVTLLRRAFPTLPLTELKAHALNWLLYKSESSMTLG